jgi:hypothetical protein
MSPEILGARMVSMSANGLHCWEVRYLFADRIPGMTVCALDESQACAKAADDLRHRFADMLK